MLQDKEHRARQTAQPGRTSIRIMDSHRIQPVVSILLATYNRAHLLPRALDSVLKQTVDTWELVIIDDGSCDDSRSLLKKYETRDKRIRWLYQDNRGLVVARNRAARLASGRWLTFLDSDDEYLPNHLQVRLDYLNSHPHIDMLHGGFIVVGGDPFVPDIRDPGRLIHLSECVVGGTFFIRKDAFFALGGFRPPDFGCDHELFLRASRILSIEKVAFSTYVYHRDSQDSMCNLKGDTSAPAKDGGISREQT